MTTTLVNVQLDDEKAERVRRSHATCIQELQSGALKPIPNVSLPNGATVLVSHGLGRVPLWVGIGVIHSGAVTAGFITNVGATVDQTKYIGLQANGFGATVIVDLAVL